MTISVSTHCGSRSGTGRLQHALPLASMEEASAGACHAKLAGEHLTYPVMLRMSLQLGGRPVSYALRRIDTLTQTYPTPMINLFRAVLLAMNDEIKEARALAVATHDRMRELSEGTLPGRCSRRWKRLPGTTRRPRHLLRNPLRPPRGYMVKSLSSPPTVLCTATSWWRSAASRKQNVSQLSHATQATRMTRSRRRSGGKSQRKVHPHRGDYAGAARLADEAVDLRRANRLAKVQADALADLAGVLDVAGRRDEAVAALRDALDRTSGSDRHSPSRTLSGSRNKWAVKGSNLRPWD